LIDIWVLNPYDPTYNPLADYIDVIPIVRISIDKSHLPIPDYEIFRD